MKKKFKLTLKDSTFYDFEVEAKTLEGAMDKVESEYHNGNLMNMASENHGHAIIIESVSKKPGSWRTREIANW